MGWKADKPRAARVLLACLLALGASGPVAAAGSVAAPGWAAAPGPVALAGTSATPAPGDYSVTLEQCIASSAQSERSATFVAQMVATPATQRMAMKIELQQRMRGEPEYHTVLAPGFGVWRSSEAGVKIYKYVKQVTNLAAPASYRVVVRFRWVGDKGRTIKRAELRSPRCFQPAPPATLKPSPARLTPRRAA